MSVLGKLKATVKGPTTEQHQWVTKVFGVDPTTVTAAVASGSPKQMASAAGNVAATVAKTAVNAQLDFDKGMVEGVIEGGKGLVTGTVAVAKAVGNETVALATDPKARADAGAKIAKGGQAVGDFAKTVVTDPKKAGGQVADAASSAGQKVVDAGKSVFKSYEDALAAGKGAEWVGKGVGQAALLVGGAALTDGGSLAAEGAAEGGAEAAALSGEELAAGTGVVAAEAASTAAARAAAEAAARKAAEKGAAGAADRTIAEKGAAKAVDDAPKPATPKEPPKVEDPATVLKQKIDANLPKAKDAAKPVLEKAAKAEKQITKNVQSATEELGGKMIGMDTRLKTPESLERKIATDMATGGQSAEEVAANISDAVRYTSSFPPDKLVEGAEKTLSKLKGEGNEVVQLKNTWLDPKSSYKGINVQMRSPDGQLFELQFHTPESFWAKDEGTHAIFEEMRKLPKDSPEWKKLDQQQRDIVDKLVVPKGIEKLVPIKKKGP